MYTRRRLFVISPHYFSINVGTRLGVGVFVGTAIMLYNHLLCYSFVIVDILRTHFERFSFLVMNRRSLNGVSITSTNDRKYCSTQVKGLRQTNSYFVSRNTYEI